MSDALLHVYGHAIWHDDVQIVGNVEGLVKLREAIDRALTDSATASSVASTFFTGDGEGFAVTVQVGADTLIEWGPYVLPYTMDPAIDSRPNAVDPRRIFTENDREDS